MRKFFWAIIFQMVLAPDGTFVEGSKWQLTPGGTFISDYGRGWQLAPSGAFLPVPPAEVPEPLKVEEPAP
jgi:hypothetical protein